MDRGYFFKIFEECSDYKDKVLLYSFLIAFAVGFLSYDSLVVLFSGIGLGFEILGANATKKFADLSMRGEDGEKYAKIHDYCQWISYGAWVLMMVFCVL